MLLDLLEPPGRCSGCGPHDGEVDGCAVEIIESGWGRRWSSGVRGRTLMMMLLLRPPAAPRATGLRQQPDRNRTDNGGACSRSRDARR